MQPGDHWGLSHHNNSLAEGMKYNYFASGLEYAIDLVVPPNLWGEAISILFRAEVLQLFRCPELEPKVLLELYTFKKHCEALMYFITSW